MILKTIYFYSLNHEMLCQAVVEAARRNAPSLTSQAEETAQLFKQAFFLFGKCHRGYNSACFLSNEELAELG